MFTNHEALARRAFDLAQLPPPLRSPTDALRYISLLLSMLPPEEGAGYVGKGGDNIAPLPSGVTVSVSRIGYPDGQLYKVMSDAPNGNPQWVDNGLRPSDQTYVPYAGSYLPPPSPTPPVPEVNEPVAVRLLHLENDGVETDIHLDLLDAQTRDLFNLHTEVDKQIGIINQSMVGLDRKLNATIAAIQEAQGKKPKWWPF